MEFLEFLEALVDVGFPLVLVQSTPGVREDYLDLPGGLPSRLSGPGLLRLDCKSHRVLRSETVNGTRQPCSSTVYGMHSTPPLGQHEEGGSATSLAMSTHQATIERQTPLLV